MTLNPIEQIDRVAMPPDLQLKIVDYTIAMPDIQSVRSTVFQVEQGVAAELDFDGEDDRAQHWVAYLDRQPIGTARIRWLNSQLVKIERVAVLVAYRGQGIGQKLMQAILDDLDQRNVAESKVHAQKAVTSFYSRLGFKAQGDEFYEAGIPHVEMRRFRLNSSLS